MDASQTARQRLLDSWSWQQPWRIFTVRLSFFLSFLTVLLSSAFIGLHSLWCLLIFAWGLIYAVFYRRIERAMVHIRARNQSAAGRDYLMEDGYSQLGKIRSPAVLLLDNQQLTISPVFGQPEQVAVSDIQALEVQADFPGRRLLGKQTLCIQTSPRAKPIYLALPRSRIQVWAQRLSSSAASKAK